MKKGIPFIYLFEYISSYFFFDVNKNQILEINRDLYNSLKEIQDIGFEMGLKDVPENVKESIISLCKEGYLSSNKSQMMEHSLTQYSKDYLEGNLKGLILQVTQNCNLKCRYCIYSGDGILSRKHNKKNMSWDIAKRTIDFFTKNSKFSDCINISFYGGEPMLNFDLIKKSVEYCNNLLFDKRIIYQITINGTILKDEHIKFFNENNFELTISLDGPAELHNINRRFATNGNGSHDVIYKNLKRIHTDYPEYYKSIKINAVSEQDRDFNMVESYFSDDELLRNISITINKVSDTYLKGNYNDSKEYACDMETIKFKMLLSKLIHTKTNYYGNKLNAIYQLNQIFKPMEKLPKAIHHQGPCMPGYNRLFVDIYGNFRVCEKASENSLHMRIGNIDQGFDYNNIANLLNIGKLTEEDCLNCYAVRACKICPVVIDSVNELSVKLKKKQCAYQKNMFQHELFDYILYRKIGII